MSVIMAVWPPTLAALQEDMGAAYEGTDRDNERLQTVLDAAVAFVQRVHEGRYVFDGDTALSGLPAPPDDLVLGVLRLAARWHTRRRSPQALVDMAEMGSARVPSFDPDIDRLLQIGRYRAAVFA